MSLGNLPRFEDVYDVFMLLTDNILGEKIAIYMASSIGVLPYFVEIGVEILLLPRESVRILNFMWGTEG